MPTSLNRRLREGIAAAQAKQFDRARPLLEEAAQQAPGDPLAWFWLAVVSPAAEGAIECLRRVLAIDATHAPARDALARVLLSQATTVASSGDRAKARALATEAAQLTPDAVAVWLALAALTEDPVERLEALRRAASIDPVQPQVRTKLREALVYRALMIGKTDRAGARTLFREAAALDPSDARIWQALAKLAETPGDAIEPLRELLRVAPGHQPGRTALKRALAADARALANAARTVEACARWREILAVDDRDIDGWLGLADATTDDDEAQHAIDAAVAIDPDDERVTAAVARLRSLNDPSAFVPPVDAFARFEADVDVLASIDPAADVLASLDATDAGLPTFEVPAAPKPAQRSSDGPSPALVAAEGPSQAAPDRPAEAAAASASIPEPAAASAPAQVWAEFEIPVAPETSGTTAAPVETAAAATAAAVAPDDAAPAANGSSRRTVMVVDDSPTIRKILGLTLERAGYKVVAEPDGESAVERLNHVVPDLILLDIAMPKLDGYEVCKRIKKDSRTAHVPVVMLSGKDAFFDKVKGHMAGATEYLTKPFETPTVLAVVANHCQALAEAVNG